MDKSTAAKAAKLNDEISTLGSTITSLRNTDKYSMDLFYIPKAVFEEHKDFTLNLLERHWNKLEKELSEL